MIFSPDDFRDDPYTSGLNQMGHVMFGAALNDVGGWIFAAAAFVFWEAMQLRYMGARKHDYYQDCLFWGTGVYMASSEWLAVTAVLMGGAWMGVTWLVPRK